MSTPDARERLLDQVVAYAAENGIADVSLRTLAGAIGSSHRMLIYHFGSREGLLAAVVSRVEATQREITDALAETADDPAEMFRRMWAGLADPAMHEKERLSFEVFAMALRGRPGTEAVLESLVEPWLKQGEELGQAMGMTAEEASTTARLGIALTRGLLLDLLATGDRDGVDAAIERFITAFLPSRPTLPPTPPPAPPGRRRSVSRG